MTYCGGHTWLTKDAIDGLRLETSNIVVTALDELYQWTNMSEKYLSISCLLCWITIDGESRPPFSLSTHRTWNSVDTALRERLAWVTVNGT